MFLRKYQSRGSFRPFPCSFVVVFLAIKPQKRVGSVKVAPSVARLSASLIPSIPSCSGTQKNFSLVFLASTANAELQQLINA